MTINETLNGIGDYLKTLPELNGIGVVVDKQQNMEQEMQRSVQRSRGYVVVVGEVDNRSADDDAGGPRVELVFGVTVYSPQVVAEGGVTGAALRDAIIRGLHHHRPLEAVGSYHEVYYKDGKPFIERDKEGRTLMIHAMKFKTTVQY